MASFPSPRLSLLAARRARSVVLAWTGRTFGRLELADAVGQEERLTAAGL